MDVEAKPKPRDRRVRCFAFDRLFVALVLILGGKFLFSLTPERLWCLFELAAFLKSKTTQKQHLVVRPIFFGPLSIAIYLTLFALALPISTVPIHTTTTMVELLGAMVLSCLAVAFPTVSTLRSYFRDLDTMKLQLLSISVDSARSSCCDVNHVTPSGGRIPCDRKMPGAC